MSLQITEEQADVLRAERCVPLLKAVAAAIREAGHKVTMGKEPISDRPIISDVDGVGVGFRVNVSWKWGYRQNAIEIQYRVGRGVKQTEPKSGFHAGKIAARILRDVEQEKREIERRNAARNIDDRRYQESVALQEQTGIDSVYCKGDDYYEVTLRMTRAEVVALGEYLKAKKKD